MGMVYRQAGRRNWLIKYYRDGRPIVESARTDDKTQAKKLLRKRETQVDEGLPINAKVGRVRFEDLASDIQHEYQANGRRTLEHLKRRIRLHLKPFFGARRMATLTTSDVLEFVAERQTAGASNAEINRELAALKRMFTLAVRAGKLLHKPHIPMLEERNVRAGFFEIEQFEAVRNRLPPALRHVATFAYVTGWRVPSEVLTLQWRQVDFDAGVIRLEPDTTKNNEGRTFPFDTLPELVAALEAQRDARPKGRICPWVFHQDGDPFMDADGAASKPFRDAWRSACEAAGCPGRIPHDFRRTAVRNLVRAGVPEKVAMQLTGHKTRSVFDRYDIVNEADLRSATAKLAARRGQVARAQESQVG